MAPPYLAVLSSKIESMAVNRVDSLKTPPPSSPRLCDTVTRVMVNWQRLALIAPPSSPALPGHPWVTVRSDMLTRTPGAVLLPWSMKNTRTVSLPEIARTFCPGPAMVSGFEMVGSVLARVMVCRLPDAKTVGSKVMVSSSAVT